MTVARFPDDPSGYCWRGFTFWELGLAIPQADSPERKAHMNRAKAIRDGNIDSSRRPPWSATSPRTASGPCTTSSALATMTTRSDDRGRQRCAEKEHAGRISGHQLLRSNRAMMPPRLDPAWVTTVE